MRRLEIRRFEPDWPSGQNPDVIVIQARDAALMTSVVGAPIERRARRTKLADYEIELEIDGAPFVILMHELAAQPKSEIGPAAIVAENLEWEFAGRSTASCSAHSKTPHGLPRFPPAQR